MHLSGVQFLSSLVAQGGFSAKMVFNQNGAIFFPVNQQHRDQKANGISYDEDKGNVLAAMLAPEKIEIRYQKNFSDQRVATMVSSLLAQSELSFMRGWQVYYQGRKVLNG